MIYRLQMFAMRKTSARRILLGLILLQLLPATLPAADWPCWRGPDGLGVSTEKSLPVQWGKDKNIAWKTALPGKGASSPVIVGNRVYLTAQPTNLSLHVLAISRERGEILWDREIGRGTLHANKLHNMASPTPMADGQHVWAMFGTGDLACLDNDGKILWQRNLVQEYGVFKFGHGYGSSPMLDAGRLFIVCMHQGPSYVLILLKNPWSFFEALGWAGSLQAN